MGVSYMTNDDLKIQKVQDTLTTMQQWPHWNEIFRGAEKEYGMDRKEFDQVLPEYQRFMALSTAFPGLGMLGERVDVIWHSHILNTVRYKEFCDLYIGRFVNHLPCSSYDLYLAEAAICKEPPATCMDPFPAPPDPSPVPPKHNPDSVVARSIINASPQFVEAYTMSFGESPSLEFWPRVALVALVDAVAQ